MSDVIAVIQARVGSTRLPGKTLEVLYDKSLLGHILERIAAARTVTRIVVATTTSPLDAELASTAREFGASLFRGSEHDVLDRFCQALQDVDQATVVRVTADDPFKDPEIVDQAVNLHRDLGTDYCSNTIVPSFPEGLDIEVFTLAALRLAHRQALLQSEREHVTPFIWKRPDKFRLHNFTYTEDLSHLRWTIDYACDLGMAREVYRSLYPSKRIFLMRDILALLNSHPEAFAGNENLPRNEGYLKSISKD